MTNSVDVSELDDLLNEHDAVGDWEEAAAPTGTQRWLFPRFPGAQNIGTCTTHDGVHVFMDEVDGHEPCADFTQDPGNMYMSRSGIGYDTDVETIDAWLDAPRNMVGAVNLIGDPGTGKTALIEAAATHGDRELLTWLCTPDDTRDSLFLRFVGEGKGDPLPSGQRSPYTLGPIPTAAKFGRLLYMDEWMRLDEGVQPVLYSLADGRHTLPGGNVDGSPMDIHPNFRLALSSNPLVRGAAMTEPMASRTASTTLTVETSDALLIDMGIDESVVAAWQALREAKLWKPAIRELRLADYWLALNPTQAVSAFLPEHCPESQRKQIRDLVSGFLGGYIRDDGRLVVA